LARARSPAATAKASERSSAAKLARLGLATDWDFLLHLPLRYVDETRLTPIADLRGGEEAQVEGTIVASEISYRGRRQLTARLSDETGEVLLRFLHFYPSQSKSLAAGRRVRALGVVRGGTLGLEMVHPRVRSAADAPLPTRLTPVYPATEGITQPLLRARIQRALRDVSITDTVPEALRARFELTALEPALRDLHEPPPGADIAQLTAHLEPFWLRIRFDELLAQQLTLRALRARRAERNAPSLRATGDVQARLRAALPFTLTGAQQRVWHEVERDLASGMPMHRLVQGDVGSGKTVIAALAAACAIDAGYQAALMAPTEILAEQHFGRIEQWLTPLGVRVAWLTGKLKASEKKAVHAAIAQGEVQLVVGTHALVQDKVTFARLGLAIVDEQHRFGVAQRLALRDAAVAPHLLMLSATPIPRTLAMSFLADVDVSVIDEMPPGRLPVATKLVSTARRDEVLARIRNEARAGRQIYWVCPLVDESEKLEPGVELTAATTMYEQTRALLPDLRLGLLHGQLPGAEKAAVMQAFAQGRVDVLVATTVIEVGVDVANASLMVIDHAQRFGLAQLHQLRGRVGRGAMQSYCVLLFDEPLSEAARERLKVIYETTDGFEVARRDLQLRGPGEFLGVRQAGVPLLRFADLERDAALVEIARDAATILLEQHPALAAEHVRRWLGSKAAMLEA
jgi:ATP-dependent DNA helicase RecG